VCRGVLLKKGYGGISRATDSNRRTSTSEQILLSGRSGEGYSALRDWRPIPAVLLAPIRRTLFRGLKTIPFTTGQNNPWRSRQYRQYRHLCQTKIIKWLLKISLALSSASKNRIICLPRPQIWPTWPVARYQYWSNIQC